MLFSGKSSCKQHTAAVVTVEDMLSRPLDSLLLPAEQQLLTRRSLVTSLEDNVLKVKTGGQVTKLLIHPTTNSLCIITIQPMTFVHVRQPRLTNKQASKKTLKDRSKKLMSVRATLSKGESSSQLANEVEQLPVKDRNALASSFSTT